MGNSQTNLQAANSDGRTFTVQHTSTDSPILPAANLAQLKEIDPSLIDFVKDETAKEAASRRKNDALINWFIFIEKISGVLVGGLIAAFVFSIGGYLVLQGHDAAGVGICGAGLVSIVALFVNRQNNLSKKESPAVTPTNPKRPRQSKAKVQIPTQKP